MAVYDSVDNILTSAKKLGVFRRYYSNYGGTPTTATTSCGYQTLKKLPGYIKLPSSFGDGVNGIYFTRLESTYDRQTNVVIALEYLMGTLTVSTNTFSDGVSMPIKNVFGNSVQTASELALVHVSTQVSATTPTLTITYTDQDGNTGQTATMTFPTTLALGSCYFIHPHLANGDTGIRDITNVSISTGSAGVLELYGLLVLNTSSQGAVYGFQRSIQSNQPYIPWIGEADEKIGFYQSGPNSGHISSIITGVANY